jgi:predicted RNA-binding Zn-ribbon protein involved in translation (DUF1610 family)
MSSFWILCTLALVAVAVFLVRRRALYRACPECGRLIRRRALKCAACGTWFAGR